MDKRYYILGGALVLLIVFGILLLTSRKKTPEPTTLNILTSVEDQAGLADYISSFEAQNNAKITFSKIDSKNYELNSLNMLSAGKVDIWGVPNTWIPKQKDKLVPFPSPIPTYDQLYPKVVATDNIIDNKIYGIPLTMDTLVLFVNSSLRPATTNLTSQESDTLSAAPSDWDILTAKSRLLTIRQGSSITQAGAALGTETVSTASDILTLLMLQDGAQMTNERHTEATFHTAINSFGGESYPGAAALDFYTGFAKKNNLNYSFSEDLGDPLTAFTNGKIAFYFDYSAREKDIKRLNPNLGYSIKPVPQVKATEHPVNFASYETFTVPKTSKNQALAWQFIQGLTDAKSLQKYFQNPANKGKTPALLSLEQGGSVVEKSLETAVGWYNPDAAATETIFRQAIVDTRGGQKAQTVLEGAATQITNLLGAIKE